MADFSLLHLLFHSSEWRESVQNEETWSLTSSESVRVSTAVWGRMRSAADESILPPDVAIFLLIKI